MKVYSVTSRMEVEIEAQVETLHMFGRVVGRYKPANQPGMPMIILNTQIQALCDWDAELLNTGAGNG